MTNIPESLKQIEVYVDMSDEILTYNVKNIDDIIITKIPSLNLTKQKNVLGLRGYLTFNEEEAKEFCKQYPDYKHYVIKEKGIGNLGLLSYFENEDVGIHFLSRINVFLCTSSEFLYINGFINRNNELGL